MTHSRLSLRWFFRSVSGPVVAVALLAAPGAVMGQGAWKPDRPVELISGSAAGNSIDIMLRTIAKTAQEKRYVEVPVNVMNRPGGGNTVAWNYLSQRAGDGHYLMVANLNLSAGHLTGTTTYSYRDFTPVCILFDEYVAFVVKADSPVRDGRDLIERLKKDPASLSLSFSSVAGGANHIAAGLVLKTAGVDVKKVRTVVFDSASKAITAALGGHVDIVSASASVPVSHLRAGTVRVVGITSPRRLGGVYADVPTWREQGANATFSNYRGMIGPKGLPPAQLAYWEGVFAALDKDESWRADLEKNLWVANFTNGRDTRKYWDELAVQLRATLDDLGLLKQ
jgi:putative tricarboxylic transport membrane protein